MYVQEPIHAALSQQIRVHRSEVHVNCPFVTEDHKVTGPEER